MKRSFDIIICLLKPVKSSAQVRGEPELCGLPYVPVMPVPQDVASVQTDRSIPQAMKIGWTAHAEHLFDLDVDMCS
jgi:hypothetical protein